MIAEIKKIRKKHILFIDDNIGADMHHAKRLFTELIPLNKRWYAQIGVNVANDPECMELNVVWSQTYCLRK